MANKVPSVEEFMHDLRPDISKKATEAAKETFSRVKSAREVQMPDYSEIVREKIEKDGLSKSSLKAFRVSPLSFIHYITQPKEDTEATIRGKAVDTIITEPEKWDERFLIMPDDTPDARSNMGKAIRELYKELAEGKIVISKEQFDGYLAMAEAVFRNSDSRWYVDKMFRPQEKINFTHPETGLKMRGILDWSSDPNDTDPRAFHFICDLKSTLADKAHPDNWPKEFVKWENHLQAGVYTLAYKYSKYQFPDFVNIVVESVEPYNVNVFRFDPAELKEAQEEVHNTLLTFKHCLDHNLWGHSYDFIRYDVDQGESIAKYDILRRPGYYKPKF